MIYLALALLPIVLLSLFGILIDDQSTTGDIE